MYKNMLENRNASLMHKEEELNEMKQKYYDLKN